MNKEYENPSKIRNLVTAGIIAVPLILGGKAAANNEYEKQKRVESQQTEIVVPQKEQKLPRFKWVGNVEPAYDAWATGSTLTSSVSKIRGPAKIEEEKSFKDVYINIENPNEICFNQVEFRGASKEELEKILKSYEENNPYSKRNFLKEEYSNRNIIAKVDAKGEVLEAFNKAIKDGDLTEEELAKLPNGFYGFYYLAKNKEDCKNIIESLPGLVYIDYKPVEKVEKLEEKVEKPVEEEVKDKVPTGFISRIGVGADWNINELVVPYVNYGLGFPIDNSHLFINLRIGCSYAEFENPDRVNTTPEDPITGFYGNGVVREKGEMADFEILPGITFTPAFAKWLNFSLYAGPNFSGKTTEEEIIEQIYNRAGKVVAENKDFKTYGDLVCRLKLLGGVGVNIPLNENLYLGFNGYGGAAINFVNPEDSKAVASLETYLGIKH